MGIDEGSKSSALNGRKLQSDYGYQACLDENRDDFFHRQQRGQPDFGFQDCLGRTGPCCSEYYWNDRNECEAEARVTECEEEARLLEQQYHARIAAFVPPPPPCTYCTLLGLSPQISSMRCCRPATMGTVFYYPSCGASCPDPATPGLIMPLEIQENLVPSSDGLLYWSRLQQFS